MFNEDFDLVKTFQAHTDYIWRIMQSPFNESIVATCSYDFQVKIWDPSNFKWSLIQEYTGHVDQVFGLEYLNENTVISGSNDHTIHIWNISTGLASMKINTGWPVSSIQLLSNRIDLASGLQNGYINIYSLTDGSLNASILAHIGWVEDLVLLNNGNLLVSSGEDKMVRIWDLSTYANVFHLAGHASIVYGLKQISLDIIASSSYDFTIKLWNSTSGSLIKTLTGHNGGIYLSFDLLNGDGSILVSGSEDKAIKFWDIQKGVCLKTIETDLLIDSLSAINQTNGASMRIFLFVER